MLLCPRVGMNITEPNDHELHTSWGHSLETDIAYMWKRYLRTENSYERIALCPIGQLNTRKWLTIVIRDVLQIDWREWVESVKQWLILLSCHDVCHLLLTAHCAWAWPNASLIITASQVTCQTCFDTFSSRLTCQLPPTHLQRLGVSISLPKLNQILKQSPNLFLKGPLSFLIVYNMMLIFVAFNWLAEFLSSLQMCKV